MIEAGPSRTIRLNLARLKNEAVHVASKALLAAGVISADRRHRGRLVIATFHRVLPEHLLTQYPYPGLAVTPEQLDWLLAGFARHYRCGPLREMHRLFRSGEPFGKPLLAITFDDGQLDSHRYAAPVLATHKLTASFFVPVDSLESGTVLWHDRLAFAVTHCIRTFGSQRVVEEFASVGGSLTRGTDIVGQAAQAAKRLGPRERLELLSRMERLGPAAAPDWAGMMSWAQVHDLANSGHEIGSHSMSHSLMPQCNSTELDYELGQSRRVIEERIDEQVESFCYPNGDADARCATAVGRAGYLRAVTTRWGANGTSADDFQLHRFDMDARRVLDGRGHLSAGRLAWRMSGLYPGLADTR